jgi:XTP/dITP diphosphohydrolase
LRPWPKQRIVVATTNPGKMAEYRDLLATAPVEIDGLDADVNETGDTYEENAILKARAAAATTGLPALADDSGLEVEALGGEPGLHSRRLATSQAARNQALWDRLSDTPRPWKARFVCVIALATPDGAVETFRGVVDGELLPEPRGEGGFGYDPVFLLLELGQTFGEIDPAEKHRWSHRGRALELLRRSGSLARLSTIPS